MIKLDYFSNDRFRRIYTPTIAVIFLSLALIPFVGSAEADVPVGTIDAPVVGTMYNAGDTILFSGSASDIEDGTLPASAYEWTIIIDHPPTHIHPFNQFSGVTSGSFTIPNIGHIVPGQFFHITLTVTDSDGLTHTSFRDILPNTSTITLDTNPTGLKLKLDYTSYTTPYTFESVVGFTNTLDAPLSQTLNGDTYDYDSWSDGGAAFHTISTPAIDSAYTATYIFDIAAPVVSASPTSGSFFNSVDVTMSATDDFDPAPTIHYTMDGSTPTTASPVYTAPITITFPTTLNFIAVDSSGNVSPISTENYVITATEVTPPVVSASPTSGTFVSSVDVTMSATDNFDPAPTIHYTTDGSTPTTASPVYTAPITITFPTTLNFIAVDSSGNVSPVSTESYVIIPPTAATLTVISVDLAGDPFPGFYTTIHEGGTLIQTGFAPVTFIGTIGTTYTVETQDYLNWLFGYWEDGSTVAPRQITLNSDTTVTSYYTDSTGDVTPPVVSASPTSGSFFNSVDVTMSATDDFDPAPTIHYTMDGSTPTTASPVYTAPITITFPTTLNFIAVDSSGNVSPISTENYVITATEVTPPVVSASPTGGTYVSSVVVTLSATDDFDPSPTIHYTMDGSPPTASSPVYTAPLTITTDTTLNFMAKDATGNTSPVSTEVYEITILPNTPPNAPTGLIATAVSPSQINLSWSAPTDDGNSPIIGYQIEVKVGSGPWSTLVENTGTSTLYSHTGLLPDITYTYRVSALNSNGGNVYGVYASLYTDPGDGSSLSPAWQRVYDAKVAYPDVRIIITANPSNGPGSSSLSDFEYSIAALRSIGVSVLGYVSTDWNNGPKTNAEIIAEIDNWVSFYGDGALGDGLGITGIMLDEMANDIDANGFNGDNVGWYTSLTDYIKNTKGLSYVQGNPGVETQEAYVGSVDQINFYESPRLPNLDNLFNDWETNYPKSNFLIRPHTVPILDEDYVRESHQYVRDIYIQDDGADGNPWDSLSSHFERIVEIQAEGISAPSTEKSATTQTAQPQTQNNGMDSFVTSGWNGYVHLVKFTNLTPGSQIDSVAIKIANPSGNIRYKVYQDNGAGANPSTLLGQSNSIPAQAGTVYNSLISPAIVPASGTVWVGFETDSSQLSIHYGIGLKTHTAHPYGSGPSPFGGSAGSNTYAIWTGIEMQSSTTPPPSNTVPGAPTGLAATATSTSQINLSWNAPSSNGGSPLTGYKIERQIGSGSWTTIAANAGTSTLYSDSGLTAGTTYTYRVSAINSVGTGSTSSTTSATTTQTAQPQTQNNGMDSFVTSGWNGYVHLVKFTNLTPGSQIDSVAIKIANPSGNIRYKVYQDNGAGANPSTLLGQSNSIPAQAGTVYNSLISPAIVPASGTVWVGFETDSSQLSIHYGIGLKTHTAHPYGSGPSPFGGSAGSNTYAIWTGIEMQSSTTPPPSNTVPGAPTGLAATATSTSQINLSWNAPSSNGGSPLTGYKIERQIGSGSWTTIAANAGTSTLYSDSGLTAGTTYTYRVSAINSVGTGSTSSTTSATTTQTAQPQTQNNGMDSFVTSGWNGYVHLVKFTNLTPGSQIDSVAIKIANPSGNIRYKVYQDNGAGANPSTLLGQSNSIPAQAGTVYNSLISPAIVPASGTVWVGFETDSSQLSIHYGKGLKTHTAHPYGSGPSPFGGSVGTNNYAIWAGIEIAG